MVMASGGYPGTFTNGKPISGLDHAEKLPHVKVFHAGTAHSGNQVVTAGGRVLGVTASGPTLELAASRAYEAVEGIRFDGMQYRKDIARAAIGNRLKLITGSLWFS